MKNKLKKIILGVVGAIFLQAPVMGYAVELPFVPVDDPQTDTVTAAMPDDDIPVVTEKQTSATSAAVTASKPTTTSTKKTETSNAEKNTATTTKSVSTTDSVPPDEAPLVDSDSENNALPVDSSEMQTTAHSDSTESSETSEESNLPMIISVICGAAVIVGAVLFAIIRKGKK